MKAVQMAEPKSEARNIQQGRSPFGFRISCCSAFTLLELLVVLAVIGLVSATLLPALAKSRPNSLAFRCLNNNRQLCVAWRMYADDNRDLIVYSSDDGRGSANPLNQYAWTWSHLDYSANPANWDTNVDIVLRP